jgi:hypothetical protein
MKTAALAALAALLCAGPLRAEDAKPQGTSSLPESTITWFRHLRQGLSESAVRHRYQRRSAVAVAAVRGAPQDSSSADPDKPDWKLASKSEKAAAKQERAELAAAVDQITTGKLDDGRASLAAFEKAHPKSRLLPEVAQVREHMKDLEPAQGAAPEAKPAGEPAKPVEAAKPEDRAAPAH